MFNVKKAAGGGLGVGDDYGPENSDFAAGLFAGLPVYPSPFGRPVSRAMIGHEWMVPQW